MSDDQAPLGRTRAATRASQDPAPARVAPQPTPRRTQARAPARTPARRQNLSSVLGEGLPEVPLGPNFSYGSAGRVDLGGQMTNRPSTQFTSAMGGNRGTAVNRGGPAVVSSPTRETRAVSATRSVPPPARKTRASSGARSMAPQATSKGTTRARRTPYPARPFDEDEEEESIEEDDEEGEIEIEEELEGIEEIHGPSLPLQQSINDNVTSTENQDTTQFGLRPSITGMHSTFEYAGPVNPARGSLFSRPLAPGRTFAATAARAPTAVMQAPTGYQHFVASMADSAAWAGGHIRRWPRAVTDTLSGWWDEAPGPFRATIAIAPFVFLILSLLQYTSVPRLGAELLNDVGDFFAQSVNSARNATLRKPMFDNLLHSRIESIESDLKTLKLDVTHMSDLLPNHILVKSNPETKKLEISPSFWEAVQQKLNHDYALKPGSADRGANMAWDKFVQSNKAGIESIIQASSRGHIDELVSSEKIVSKQMFLHMVDEHNSAILSRVEAKLAHVQASSERIARDAATRIANEIARRRAAKTKDEPKYLDDAVVKAFVDRELYDRERNFFGRGLGAVVDPYLTSPTYTPTQPHLAARLWAWSGLSAVGSHVPWWSRLDGPPNTPAAALAPWSDVGDCWCAAKSGPPTRGAAQLAVLLGYDVQATALLVDHVEPTATLDVAAAPQRLEVWGLPPDDSPHNKAGGDDDEKGGKEKGCVAGPPQPGRGWRCLGAGEYSIHAGNRVQAIPLGGGNNNNNDAGQSAPLLVRKVVVRVLANWGAERTCIYRVRLLGKDRDEVEYEMGLTGQ